MENKFQAIVGLFLIIVIAVSSYYFVSYFFSGVDKTVIVALITIFGSSFAIAVGKYMEKKRDIEQEIRKQKIPVYEDFISFVFDTLKASKSGESLDEKAVVDRMFKINRDMIVWGSDGVILQWIFFRGALAEGASNLTLMLSATAKIFLEIRKDIGHTNIGLSEKGLLSTFVNDIDDLM